MEIGRLVRNPDKGAFNLRVLVKGRHVGLQAGQLGIADMRMNGAMADRVNGHRLPAALASRGGMVMLDPTTEGPAT